MRRIAWFEWLAVAGSVVFIAWILYNGIDEGFAGTLPEKVSMVTLIALLVFDAWLIATRRRG
jgi:hypothetical protein